MIDPTTMARAGSRTTGHALQLPFCVLTLGVGLILASAAGETAVRVFGLSRTVAMRQAASRRPPIVGGPLAPRYAPGASWSGPYGAAYRSNKDGYRDRDFPVAKAAGAVRIAVVGDSVAEGLGVAEDERFARRLEDVLNGRATRRVEVLTFALAGYATLDERLALERDALRYAPSHVILQVCFNDVDENRLKAASPRGMESGTERPGLRRLLQGHSALYLFLAERWNGLLLQRGLPTRLLQRVLAVDDAAFAQTADAIGGIAAVCLRADAQFLVTYVPQDAEVRVASETSATHFEGLVAAASARLGVRFVSVLPALRGARGCATHIDDCHLSACGHRIVAEALAASFLDPLQPQSAQARREDRRSSRPVEREALASGSGGR